MLENEIFQLIDKNFHNVEKWKETLEKDFDINYVENNISLLSKFCKCLENIELWGIILKKNTNFNKKTGYYKDMTTPFTFACKHIVDINIWALILEKCIDFNTYDDCYYSPMMLVFENITNIEILKLILNKAQDVDFSAKNKYGFTAFHSFCCKISDIDIWKIMLKNKKVNFNSKSNYDMYHVDHNSTPLLMLCCKNNIDIDIWKLILEFDNLDFNDANYWGHTPLSKAFKNITNIEILKLILDKNIETFDRFNFKFIENKEIKAYLVDYYIKKSKLLLKPNQINLDEIYSKYLAYVNSNFTTNNTDSTKLFCCRKSTGTHSYFMPYAFPDNNYKWCFQIATGGDYCHKFKYVYFPVAFYNPHDEEITCGLLADEQVCGNYTLGPKQAKLIFNNGILPFIPYLEKKGCSANMIVLMKNKLEPEIIYCNLLWCQINNLLDDLYDTGHVLIMSNNNIHSFFEVISDDNGNKFVTSWSM